MKRLALLLLPVVALAGDFVTNPSATLPGPKTDARNLPVGSDPNKYLRATDYNAVRDAANDLRDYVRAPNDALVTSTGGTTARALKDRFADVVNVKDYLPSGQPDGTTDNTAGILAAIATDKPVFFPAGTYVVGAQIAHGTSKAAWMGAGRMNTTLKATGANGGAAFFKPPPQTSGIRFRGDANQGTGLQLGADGVFVGQAHWSDLEINDFALAVDVYNLWAVNWSNIYIQYNTNGVRIRPADTAADDGYFTTWHWNDVVIYSGSGYGIDAQPPLGNKNWIWHNVSVQGMATGAGTTAQITLKNIKLHAYSSYFEGTPSKPAFYVDNVTLFMIDGYFNGTGGLDAGARSFDGTFIRTALVSSGDKTWNMAGGSLQKLRLWDTTQPTDVDKSMEEYVGISQNGNAFYSRKGKVKIGARTATTLDNVSGFTKVLGTVTVPANSRTSLISDYYAPAVFSGTTTAHASIVNGYFPDIDLIVTPATTGNTDYFCVIAVNRSASPAVLDGKTIAITVQSFTGVTIP